MSESRVAIIQDRLTQALAPLELNIQDDSARHAGHAGAQSGGGHFIVQIVSAAFAGKSLVQRHRLVYDALGDMMDADIHALSIQAKTPDD